MFEDHTRIIAILEKSRSEYKIKADAFEKQYYETNDEDIFAEFELCYTNIYEIDDQIRYYSKKRLAIVTRIKRFLVFYR